MRWILTRRRRLPLALAVVLACAPPSVMPSRLLMTRGRRCGCQGASSPSPRIRSNHDAVTANVAWDALNRRGRYMTVYSGWGRRGQGRDGEGWRGMARESEGERGRAREGGEKSDLSLFASNTVRGPRSRGARPDRVFHDSKNSKMRALFLRSCLTKRLWLLRHMMELAGCSRTLAVCTRF